MDSTINIFSTYDDAYPRPPPPTPLEPSFAASTNDIIEGTILTLKTLESFGNGELLLSALRDAISEHGQKWYKSNGASTHGNINPATIGIVPSAAYPERLHAQAPRGFLVSAKDISPNPVFQSVKALAAFLQKAEQNRTGVASGILDHDYSLRHLDDLESFYYILLYLCIPYTIAGLGENSASEDKVQRDDHAFHTINTEIFVESARFMTGIKSTQENLNAIGVSDLSWIIHPTSSAAIRAKERIMSAIPCETQDHHDFAATARHLVRKSFHPQWVFERLLGQLLIILKKCNERDSELERGALLRHQHILDAGMMDYVHFIQAFDKAIERVRKCSSAFDPFLDYRDWEIEVDEQVYFNSDDEEEDKRPLPSWINEWLEEVDERMEDDKGSPMGDNKKKVNGFKGLGLVFPRLGDLRIVTSRM